MSGISIIPAIISISIGASLGAVTRWLLSLACNQLFTPLALGTLLANFIGSFVVGLALALFAHFTQLADEWKLFIITGFAGGLSTFSSYAAEMFSLIQQGRWATAVLGTAAHVCGSIICVALGLLCFHLIKSKIA